MNLQARQWLGESWFRAASKSPSFNRLTIHQLAEFGSCYGLILVIELVDDETIKAGFANE